jgi:hypothetical protein
MKEKKTRFQGESNITCTKVKTVDKIYNFYLYLILLIKDVPSISRVIMSPTELKMQPTIHSPKSWILKLKYPGLLEMYCGLHFQFRRAFITPEIPRKKSFCTYFFKENNLCGILTS